MGNGTKLVIAGVFGLIVYNAATRHYAPTTAGIERGVAPVERAPRCTASDFAVEGVSARREYDYVWVIGKVTNNGSLPCGVQLKASSYDKAGAVVDTTDFWPASVRNIRPGATENFKHYLHAYAGAKTYDVEVIDARAWRD